MVFFAMPHIVGATWQHFSFLLLMRFVDKFILEVEAVKGAKAKYECHSRDQYIVYEAG